MASHYQAVPPLRYQQIFHHDVKPLTQLSINRNDSTPLPLAKSFACHQNAGNTNTQENLLFPLQQKPETSANPVTKKAWHDLLKYLKSQSIVKNMNIFRKIQNSNHPGNNKDYQKFPVKNKMTANFPCQTSAANTSDFKILVNNKTFQQKSTKKLKKFKFPLKPSAGNNKFLFKNHSVKEKEMMFLKNIKLQKLDTSADEGNIANLRTIIRLQNYTQFKKLKKFPFIKTSADANIKNKFPLQGIKFTFIDKEKKFPINLTPILGKFPTANQNSKETLTHLSKTQFKENLLIYSYKNSYKMINLYSNLVLSSENIYNFKKFPCRTTLKPCDLKGFPVNTANCVSNITHPEPATLLPMTCKGQNVSQVQDAQFSSITTTCEHKQTPPQTFAKTLYDDDNDVYKLPAINAINSTRSNEVELGLFEKNIEHIQDAIVALFEKIQNSFSKTHNVNEHDEKMNAINLDDDGNGVSRFALTPPTNSITSVRNNERNDNNNNNDVHNKNINDFSDLWHAVSDHNGKIVESSDIRGTLAETVDYGVKKENQNTITGSFLVKSEEQPIIPYTPLPHPLTESLSTSLKRSEILPKNNVLPVNLVNKSNDIQNLEVNVSTKLNDFVINEKQSTATEKYDKKLLTKQEEIDLKDYENNHLVNDTEIDEMKYEMKRVKGALPSTLKDSRATGKHETLKTANTNYNYNRNISSNFATRPSKDLNNSAPSLSASQRLSLKSENLHCPTITNYPPPNSLNNNNTVTNISLTQPQNALNTSNDILANRRPSLSSLRSTQSTSLLSQDLTSYVPSSTTNQKDTKTAIYRGASIDSSLEDVLPERTRLRRQRRLRTQYAQDEPEDPIERLNRLKARISASLSEVKGVLKQYSTDADADPNAETENEVVNNKETPREENKEEAGPVTFRFVKRIRRRSIFPEEEEEEKDQKANDEVDHQPKPKDEHLNSNEIPKLEEIGEKSPKINDNEIITKLEIDNSLNKETNISLHTLIEGIQESLEEKSSQYEEKNNTENRAKEIQMDFEKDANKETTLDCKIPSTPTDPSCKDILAAVENGSTLSNKNQDDCEQQSVSIIKDEQTTQTFEEKALKGAIPKHSESTTTGAKAKIKTKVVLKSKDPSRRASLAAVEGSKIEPPLKVAIPAKIIRRPSDSEAVVKKKLITAKIITSGSIEEVTPKPNIVKIKRTSTKSNMQLATKKTKSIEKDAAMTALNNQSNDRVKSTDNQKSINNDKNKDVLMPKESKYNNITSQTNVLLPTQLVIDETASLKAKTIENSQLQTNQEQVQKQNQQQATATKLKSNELQKTCGDGGAMLENLTTTAISLTKTTEPNGQQIKRETKNVQPEDIHDLLQQETIIVRPSVIKPEEQVSKEHLEKDHIYLQQQKPIEQQQVVASTDAVVVKKDDVSNNKTLEIDETKTSSKEPCAVKTPTSTHVVDHECEHHLSFIEGEQSITHITDTKAISAPHISISCTEDSTQNTRNTVEKTFEEFNKEFNQNTNIMPELQLAPAPVQTAEISPKPEHHKKKVILKKIVRQASIDKTKKPEPDAVVSKEDDKTREKLEFKDDITAQTPNLIADKDESTEEISESTEVSESSSSLGSEETAVTKDEKPQKERKIKKKVIIKRQKRRLSIGDSFFHSTNVEEPQNAEVETLEKAIAYVSDDEEADSENKSLDEEAKKKTEEEEEEKQKKPLKSCIMHKEYNIGDEVLYAERFKKTQIKWRHGRIKERITSISYLLDIDGKDVSSHVNYLKKFTGRKVSFGGKEYLEIDYEQLAEEEERAEKLKRRSYSIWNMV